MYIRSKTNFSLSTIYSTHHDQTTNSLKNSHNQSWHELIYNKTYTSVKHNFFWRISPFGIAPVKKAHEVFPAALEKWSKSLMYNYNGRKYFLNVSKPPWKHSWDGFSLGYHIILYEQISIYFLGKICDSPVYAHSVITKVILYHPYSGPVM